MIIALSILAVFAIAAAIGAGSRAQQQMALSQSRSTLEKPDDAAEPRLEPLDTNQADSSALPSDSPDKRLDFRLKGQVSLWVALGFGGDAPNSRRTRDRRNHTQSTRSCSQSQSASRSC